jgi:hypothetical protein
MPGLFAVRIEGPMTNRLANAIKATGNAFDGVMLYRLKFRCDQALRAKKWGTAQTRIQLMGETGGSLQQVIDATARLKRNGFIEVERHLFANKLVNHFRLTAKAERCFRASTEQGPEASSEWCLEASFNIQGGQPGEQQGGPSGEQSLASEPPTPLEQDLPGKDQEMKAADFLAVAKIKNKMHKPDKVAGLISIWQEVYAEHFDGMCPGFTMKSQGQLGHMLKALGPSKSEAVVRYVIANWISFVKQVEADVGAKSTPGKPNLDFLLKHVNVALSLASVPETKTAGPVLKVVEQKPVQLIAQPMAEAKPSSAAEFMAFMNDDVEPQGGG